MPEIAGPRTVGRYSREIPLDPVALVGGLGLLVLLAVGLHLGHVSLHRSQQLTAAVAVGAFAVGAWLAARNGLVLLYLVPPLFNGEDDQPYFFLLEVFVYLTLAAGFTAHLWRRRPLAFPHAPIVLLFLLSTILSFPLNLGELLLEAQVLSWREILEDVRRGDLWANLSYVRAVLDVASGIGLYVLVVNQTWSRDAGRRLATAATVVFVAVTVVGLAWHRFFPLARFLSVVLHGNLWDSFTGVGFNPSYFAQYAVAYLPFVVLVLAEPGPRWAKALAGLATALGGATLLLTYQRSAYLVLLVEIGLLLSVAWCVRKESTPRTVLPIVGAVGGLSVALLGLLATPVGSKVLERIGVLWRSGDPYREHVLSVAGHMLLAEPLLGIGSGRFAHMFQFYSPRATEFHWGSLSSHNLYTQLLAEQGIVGLASFLGIIAVALAPTLRGERRLGEAPALARFLLVSLGAWLVYGLFQFTFLMRAMELYLWITLGLLVALVSPARAGWRPGRALLAAVLAVLVGAGAARVYAAAVRPVQPGLLLGLHASEPNGLRWTRGGVVMNLAVRGRRLQLDVACPIPHVAARPQQVTVWLDGILVRRITIGDQAWKTIDLPVDGPLGRHVLLQLQAGYTFVPVTLGFDDPRRLGILTRPIRWIP